MMLVDVYEPEFFREGLKDIGKVLKMETGDYVWSGVDGCRYAIERKEANDLVNSARSGGRLADQVRRMITTYDVPIILREGYVRSLGDNRIQVPKKEGGLGPINFPYTALENMLLEAQMAGIFIVQTTSQHGTLNQIRSLYKWSMEETHQWINSRSRSGELRLHRNNQIHLLMGLPTVGEKTAADLLEYFGSPIAVFQALWRNPGMVTEVRGISESRVQNMRAVLLPNYED